MFLGDLFDFHAAFGRGHQNDPTRSAIDYQSDIELTRDVHALLDEKSIDLFALRPGLMRDQLHAEDFLRCFGRATRAFGHFDAAAFAATAGVNLRLDDDNLFSGFLHDRRGRFIGLFQRERDFALRHRHAVTFEKLFALILVNLQRDSFALEDSERAYNERGDLVDGEAGGDYGDDVFVE